jgi:hypothetical protein
MPVRRKEKTEQNGTTGAPGLAPGVFFFIYTDLDDFVKSRQI